MYLRHLGEVVHGFQSNSKIHRKYLSIHLSPFFCFLLHPPSLQAGLHASSVSIDSIVNPSRHKTR